MSLKNNHFFIPYSGNKRNEIDELIEHISFEKYKNIIEPFCGSSAYSFHIWLKYGHIHDFNYYLNDNSSEIIDLYMLFKNESLEKINDNLMNIKSEVTTKEEWNNHYKNSPESAYKNLFYLKFSALCRKGFYQRRKYLGYYKPTELQTKFIEFIKLPNVYITCKDWKNVYNEHKDNEKSLILLDPPYLSSCNDYYSDKSMDVYEYFFYNKNEKIKADILFIVEDIWLTKMMFNNETYLIINTYEKIYQVSKKKTKHIIYKKV